MTADELHALAVRTRDAARLAERHGTSTHGYRRAAREACERMGEMAEQLAEAEERARLAEVDADAFQETLAKAERERDEAYARSGYAERELSDAFGLPVTIGPSPGEAKRVVDALRRERDSLRCERDSWRNMCEARPDEDAVCELHEARDALRALVDALSLDDGPRAKAIQHARAVLEEWGMR